MFKSNKLVYRQLDVAESSGSSDKKERFSGTKIEDYKPVGNNGNKEVEAKQKQEDLVKCDGLEKSMEREVSLKESFCSLVDVLFVSYRKDYLEQKLLNDDTGLMAKLDAEELAIKDLIKEQFEVWFSSIDLSESSSEEAEDTMMRYYRCLQATVKFWQSVEKGGNKNVPVGMTYGAVKTFVENASLGSKKVLMIDPSAYTGLAILARIGVEHLIVNQDSLDWQKSKQEKLEYLKKRFGEILWSFDFDGFGYWETKNKDEYMDAVVGAISSHPNFGKVDAYTVLKILYSFTEQTKYYVGAKNPDVKKTISAITEDLNYL